MLDRYDQNITICMYCTPYAPIFSGAALQAGLLIKELNKIGLNCFIITNNYDGMNLKTVETIDGVKIFRKTMYFRNVPLLKPFFISLQMSRSIIENRNNYDILHFHGGCNLFAFIPLLINKILGKKSIFKMTLLKSADDPSTWGKIFLGFLYKFSFKLFDVIVSISKPLSKNYLSSKLDQKKLVEIDQAVNTKIFSPADSAQRCSLRGKYGLSKDSLIIGFSGSLKHRKGADILIRVFLDLYKKNKDINLLIIGEHLFDDKLRNKYAPFSNEIKDLINRNNLNDNIIFTGKTNDVPNFLKTLDIFLFPSRREGLPSAVLEAMSCGLPCVVSQMDGIAKYIKGDTESILIPQNNEVASYVSLVSDLVSDKSLRRKLGENARKRILKKFYYKDTAKKYLRLYQNLLGD